MFTWAIATPSQKLSYESVGAETGKVENQLRRLSSRPGAAREAMMGSGASPSQIEYLEIRYNELTFRRQVQVQDRLCKLSQYQVVPRYSSSLTACTPGLSVVGQFGCRASHWLTLFLSQQT